MGLTKFYLNWSFLDLNNPSLIYAIYLKKTFYIKPSTNTFCITKFRSVFDAECRSIHTSECWTYSNHNVHIRNTIMEAYLTTYFEPTHTRSLRFSAQTIRNHINCNRFTLWVRLEMIIYFLILNDMFYFFLHFKFQVYTKFH